MRFFVSQANNVSTSPMVDNDTDEPITNAVVTLKLFNGDALVEDSDITLPHDEGGVYRAQWPVLDVVADELPNSYRYDVEFIVTLEGVVLHYHKGPIRAIVRTQNDVP